MNSGTKDKKAIFNSTNSILSKVDKVATPNNIKAILNGSIEKNQEYHIQHINSCVVKDCSQKLLLCDNENVVVETYVSELNRNISSYGVISVLGKQAGLDNKLHLIKPGQRLKFNLKKDFYKNKVEFELGKVHTKKLFKISRDNVSNFAILCTKKNNNIGEKRKIQSEIVDTIHILGLQNFDNYSRFNPLEITIDSNSTIETQSKYKRYKFRFIIDSLLFSSRVQNDTEVIFITCYGLTEAKNALISSKLYKMLGVVYLSEIKN